jgi:lipopolysaccharide export LptBFGC system permease protein LptF
VAVQVPAATAAVRTTYRWALAFAVSLLGMLVLPFGSECGRRSVKRGMVAIAMLTVLASTGALSGCGGSPAPATRQATNYSIVVTATSGSLSRTTTLTLTVR